MRSYLIDELNSTDMHHLLANLDSREMKASVENMYWLELPENLLTEEQREHCDQCGPFICSLETGPNWLKAELLVRGRGKLRCSCIAYATPEQRDWILERIDAMLGELDIPV